MQPARARFRSPLAFALGAIAFLLVAVELVSFGESRRLQKELGTLVRTAERSTYLLGSLGHTLSRVQSNALEALTEPHEPIGPALERVAILEAAQSERMAELPQLLSPAELEVWARTAPQIEAVMRDLVQAVRELERGRTHEVEARLDELGPVVRRILESLRVAMELNHEQTLATLGEVDGLLARARWLQLSLGTLLTAAIAAVAWRALRVLRRRELEIDRHVARVEEANRDLEAFAGRVAHDLRNVLAPLPLSARLLEDGGTNPALVAETGAGIERVSRHASELISGLLAFARAGEPAPGAVASMDEELRAVLEELAPHVRSANARVQTEVEPGLNVACDKALLHVVLLNLISNAVKFLAGLPRREVLVRCRAAQGRAVIEVTDTGPGIPADALERIFEPFYRAPGVRASGEGIGLATVSRIVEAHQGEVHVLSAEGEGSTFRVSLLLAGAPTRERRPAPIPASPRR